MEEQDGRRLNVKFRESDQTEREAARIMSKVPVRGRSHYIAEAIVAYEASCILDGCNNATIEQIAALVVSKLMNAGANPAKPHKSLADPDAPKKKRGRPRKNKMPEVSAVATDASADAPVSVNKRPQSAVSKPLEQAQEKQEQVDEDMVNSMMSLISF